MDKAQLFRKVLATVFGLVIIIAALLKLPAWITILCSIVMLIMVFWPTESEK
jgi:hypothetical protein